MAHTANLSFTSGSPLESAVVLTGFHHDSTHTYFFLRRTLQAPPPSGLDILLAAQGLVALRVAFNWLHFALPGRDPHVCCLGRCCGCTFVNTRTRVWKIARRKLQFDLNTRRRR